MFLIRQAMLIFHENIAHHTTPHHTTPHYTKRPRCNLRKILAKRIDRDQKLLFLLRYRVDGLPISLKYLSRMMFEPDRFTTARAFLLKIKETYGYNYVLRRSTRSNRVVPYG